MPLINTTYTKTASYTPSNATGVSYFWQVDGTIISGQSTDTINYQFAVTGTRNVTLTVFNACSSQDFTQSFVVCEPITGLQITGPASIVPGGDYTYSFSTTTGAPLTFNWDLDSTEATIISGQGTGTIVVHVDANATITSLVFDLFTTTCDNLIATAVKVASVVPSCIGITGCSF